MSRPNNQTEVSSVDLGVNLVSPKSSIRMSGESATENMEKAPTAGSGVIVEDIANESFRSLLQYDSDGSSSSASSDLGIDWSMRDKSDDSESSSSSTSSEDEENDDDDAESSSSSDDDSPNEDLFSTTNRSNGAIKKDKNVLKTPGEVDLDELEPVPDLSTLSINVEEEKFIYMGNVFGIVDKLVTVEAIPNGPAYDLDTILFLDEGKRPLGLIFDVLGQVSSPIYAVRFNSVEDIKKLGVAVGTKVYSAPLSKHTKYVFLQQLLKMKGSDASWKGDNEVPLEFADFSDDESERHQRFETKMNKRNILNTRFNKYMDYKQATRFTHHSQIANSQPSLQPSGVPLTVPQFDPTVPPPNLMPRFLPAEMWGGGNTLAPTFVSNFVANWGRHQGGFFAAAHDPGTSHQ